MSEGSKPLVDTEKQTYAKAVEAAADEAALSRLYAGIHYRFGVVGGQVQGRCVAYKVLALKMTR